MYNIRIITCYLYSKIHFYNIKCFLILNLYYLYLTNITQWYNIIIRNVKKNAFLHGN